MSLWSVLWSLWCRLVLRTRMFKRLYPALGPTNTLRLRGVLVSCLTRLLKVDSLSDVRCGVQISMVSDTARVTHGTTIVAHVQISLTDMTLSGCVGGVYLHYSTTIGLNHVPCPTKHLAAKPAAVLHSILDVTQILKGDDGVVVFKGSVSEFLSNEDAKFTSPVGQVLSVRYGFL